MTFLLLKQRVRACLENHLKHFVVIHRIESYVMIKRSEIEL